MVFFCVSRVRIHWIDATRLKLRLSAIGVLVLSCRSLILEPSCTGTKIVNAVIVVNVSGPLQGVGIP